MPNRITIARVLVANPSVTETLEVSLFSKWSDAFLYLEKQLAIELTEEQKNCFMSNRMVVTPAHKEVVDGFVDPDKKLDICYAVDVKLMKELK